MDQRLLYCPTCKLDVMFNVDFMGYICPRCSGHSFVNRNRISQLHNKDIEKYIDEQKEKIKNEKI